MGSEEKIGNEKSAAARSAPENSGHSVLSAGTVPSSRAGFGQALPSGVNADRERQLAVFTDFWFAAVRYQILHGLSDHGLALDILGVNNKTLASWRDCIVASGAIEDLICLIDNLPNEMRARNTQKVKDSLQARLEALKDESVPTAATRTSGLPSGTTFEDAVQRATHTVLANLVMDLDARASRLATVGTPSPRSQAVAQHLGTELIALYRAGEALDLPMFRRELESRLAKVSQLSSRLALHRVLGMLDFFQDEDGELAQALVAAVKEAKDEARSYVSKLYRRMEIDNQFSERATFRARLSAGEPLYRPDAPSQPADPFHPRNINKAKEAELKRLWRLIDIHAEIREP